MKTLVPAPIDRYSLGRVLPLLVLSLGGVALASPSSAQSAPVEPPLISTQDILDASALSQRIDAQADPIDELVWSHFSTDGQQTLADVAAALPDQLSALVEGLNSVIDGGVLYDPGLFAGVRLSPETQRLAVDNPQAGDDLPRLNRLLLEDTYAVELRRSPPTPPTQLTGTGVRTAQSDYPPGATAFITGWGFQAGETVDLQVLHHDGTPDTGEGHGVWSAVADAAGGFQTSWHVCEDDCLGSTLLLTAEGQGSGSVADWTFTDATGAGVYEQLRAFGEPSTGGYPYDNLLQGADGALYGMTTSGGSNYNGTIFKVDTDGSGFTILHNFEYSTGYYGYSDLMQTADGTLYGTTANGGTSGYGVAFRIDPDGSDYTVIHNFDYSNGGYPYAGLMQGADNALYGTTYYGGANGYGTAFKMDVDGSNYTVLHAFNYYSAEGGYPFAGLMQGADGALYGTTYTGYNYGTAYNSQYGTVFKMDPDGSNFAVLHAFDYYDGAYPYYGDLIQGADGGIYGTTYYGGSSYYGTAYRLDSDGSNFTVLHNFDYYNGGYVYAGLVEGADGALYGTTYYGGTSGAGVLFKMDADGSNYGIVHDFSYYEGYYNQNGLIQGADGVLYGMASQGGAYGAGTVFRVNTDGTDFAVILDLSTSPVATSEGGFPYAELVEGPGRVFYGTHSQGGINNAGTIFKVNGDGSGFAVLHEFGTDSSGRNPYAKMIIGLDGALYGTTYSGGTSGYGTAFRMETDGSNFTVLHSFDYYSGAYPYFAGLTQGPDGTLYGTTYYGGNGGSGTVYRMDADGANHTVLRSFNIYDYYGSEPGYPYGGVVLGTDGALYGTLSQGYYCCYYGAVFRVETDGSNFTVLHSFDYYSGAYPYAGLTVATDGAIFGTTYYGGNNGTGTVFRMDPDGTNLTTIHHFGYGADGGYPYFSELSQGADGKLYGTTSSYGAFGSGTLFQVDTDGTDFEVLLDFQSATTGRGGYAGVIEGTDGNIYGTTYDGGGGAGTVYRLSFNTPPVADCQAVQLTNIGDTAQVSFSGAESTDAEDDLAGIPLTFEWDVRDADSMLTLLERSGSEFDESLAYGDYELTLTVTDSAGVSDTCTTQLSVNPANLAVLECEKIEVKFCLGDADSDPDDDSSADDQSSGCTSDRVKIKGEVGLPMGVDHSELEAIAQVMLDAAGPDFLGVGVAPIEFEVNGSNGKHWKYRDDAGTYGVTKFDVDWKGARFKYDESGFPVKFDSELITSSATILEMEYKMSDIGGAFTVDIDGTVISVDANGDVVSVLPAGSIDVKKNGKKVVVELPFPLTADSTVTFGGALDGSSFDAIDHYTHSLGRFKLEAESGTALPLGAETDPRTVLLMMGLGGPMYPGVCSAGGVDEPELKVYSRKWKAKN